MDLELGDGNSKRQRQVQQEMKTNNSSYEDLQFWNSSVSQGLWFFIRYLHEQQENLLIRTLWGGVIFLPTNKTFLSFLESRILIYVK